MRLTLQRGLEVMRLLDNHGVGVDLVVHLARSFDRRVVDSQSQVKHLCDLERATAYWTTAVGMIERLLR